MHENIPLQPPERIICALDTRYWHEAVRIFDTTAPYVGGFKLGREIMSTHGHGTSIAGHILSKAKHIGKPVLWDAKLYDIPNTIAGAVDGIEWMGVWGFTISMKTPPKGLHAAASHRDRARMFGVSVLSSMSPSECRREFGESPKQAFARHTRRLIRHRGSGMICSGHELETIFAQRGGKGLLKIAVGTRPAYAPKNDQKRVTTPADAIRAGADYVVLGRPICAADDPAATAQHVAEEIGQAQANHSMI